MTCGITNPEAVIAWANLCNHYGLDVEGVGDTVAFAMECFEQGILTEKDTDGLPLRFRDAHAYLELTRRIAMREGDLASTLAEGTRIAAQKIGQGSERLAMNVKGGEMTAGDPRGMPVRAVSYATSTRGSDHLRSNPYIEEIMTPQEALNGGARKKPPTSKRASRAKARCSSSAKTSSPSATSWACASLPTIARPRSRICIARVCILQRGCTTLAPDAS
jgi:aldehyde:ferredoxin oxidoreductase